MQPENHEDSSWMGVDSIETTAKMMRDFKPINNSSHLGHISRNIYIHICVYRDSQFSHLVTLY